MSSTDRPIIRRDFTEKLMLQAIPPYRLWHRTYRDSMCSSLALPGRTAWALQPPLPFARTGASAIAVVDLHGVSGGIVSRVKAAAIKVGRPEPQVVNGRVDISRWESVAAFKDTVLDAFGHRLDVLVNNAAHQEPYSSILDADLDVYWKT